MPLVFLSLVYCRGLYWDQILNLLEPGRVAQSVGHLTRKSGVLGFFKKGSCQLLAKVCARLVNCLGGLSLPRKSVVRLTDRPDMTLDVYMDVKQQCISINKFTCVRRVQYQNRK